MPLTNICPNCLKSKDNLEDYYCTACITALAEADNYIAAEKIVGSSAIRQVRDNALADRRSHPMEARHDPRLPFAPIDRTLPEDLASHGLDPYERLFDPRKIGR